MKNFNSKTTQITSEGKSVSYFDLLKLVLNTPVSSGISILEMKERFNIIDKIDKSIKDSISLNDKEITLLKEQVNSYKWALMHKDILLFSEAVNAL